VWTANWSPPCEERLGRATNTQQFSRPRLAGVLKIAAPQSATSITSPSGNDSNANLAAKISHVFNAPLKSARGSYTLSSAGSRCAGFRELIAESCGASNPIADSRSRASSIISRTWPVPIRQRFDEAAGFSYDCRPHFASAMYARCRDNRIEILRPRHGS